MQLTLLVMLVVEGGVLTIFSVVYILFLAYKVGGWEGGEAGEAGGWAGGKEVGWLAGCDSLAFTLHSLEGTFVPQHFQFCIYVFLFALLSLTYFFYPRLSSPAQQTV